MGLRLVVAQEVVIPARWRRAAGADTPRGGALPAPPGSREGRPARQRHAHAEDVAAVWQIVPVSNECATYRLGAS